MRVLLSLYANLFAGTESAGVVEQECPPLQKSSQYNRFTTHSPRNRMPLSRRLASHGVTLGGRWVGLIILGMTTACSIYMVERVLKGVGISRTHPASNSLQRFTLA